MINPLDRGLYILQLTDNSSIEEFNNSDPEFLMKIMEKNEQVEDVSKDKSKVLELFKHNQKNLEQLIK